MFACLGVMFTTSLTKLTSKKGLKYLKNKYSWLRESRELCTVAESASELEVLKEVFLNGIKM